MYRCVGKSTVNYTSDYRLDRGVILSRPASVDRWTGHGWLLEKGSGSGLIIWDGRHSSLSRYKYCANRYEARMLKIGFIDLPCVIAC